MESIQRPAAGRRRPVPSAIRSVVLVALLSAHGIAILVLIWQAGFDNPAALVAGGGSWLTTVTIAGLAVVTPGARETRASHRTGFPATPGHRPDRFRQTARELATTRPRGAAHTRIEDLVQSGTAARPGSRTNARRGTGHHTAGPRSRTFGDVGPDSMHAILGSLLALDDTDAPPIMGLLAGRARRLRRKLNRTVAQAPGAPADVEEGGRYRRSAPRACASS